MDDMKKINDFAIKWCDKFKNRSVNYLELVDHYMADECDALGFKMDCGHAFSQKYGQALNNYEALNQIIDTVTDISLLGSAIYSQWRYFNHWAYTGEEILEPENRTWFILALSRLALLSSDTPLMFQGVLKKLHIVSKKIYIGFMSELDKESEQHLTINDEGCVCFTEYNFGCSGEKCEKVRSKNFKIDRVATDKMFGAIAAFFTHGYPVIFKNDIGDWRLELINKEGVTYTFRGSLCAVFDYKGMNLSNLVRDTLGMKDLYMFDGNNKPEILIK